VRWTLNVASLALKEILCLERAEDHGMRLRAFRRKAFAGQSVNKTRNVLASMLFRVWAVAIIEEAPLAFKGEILTATATPFEKNARI
jgi:hypothetical protein